MIADLEEKLENVFNNLEERPTEQKMLNTFLETYPEDWKKLKITFSKFKRSKQFGKTIPLPKPEQALRKEIRLWLQKDRL